jgi:hypothetical protein
LTNRVLWPIIQRYRNTETGSLPPEPSNIYGEGRGTPITHDDDFPRPRTRAEAKELLEQSRKLVEQLEKRENLTPDEEEFVFTYRHTFGPHKSAAPDPAPAAPLSRDQIIKNFIETETTLAWMSKHIDEEYEKIKPSLTPADLEDTSWRQDLERRLGRKLRYRSNPKPN